MRMIEKKIDGDAATVGRRGLGAFPADAVPRRDGVAFELTGKFAKDNARGMEVALRRCSEHPFDSGFDGPWRFAVERMPLAG